ncbi:MAG: 4Fe-4S dicluster domain-containing protein [Acidimicrobiia bacterium]
MDLRTVLDPPPLYHAGTCAAGRPGETGCTTCLDACPYQAIGMQHRPEGTMVSIDPGLCRRCGACTGVCPTSSLERSFQPDREIYRLVAEGVGEAMDPGPVVVFGCGQAAWNLASILTGDSVFVELRSLLVINETHLLHALRSGARGVLLFGCPACHHNSPHLLEDSLEIVRSLVGEDSVVAYIEDDIGDESRDRVRRFISDRTGAAVLSPLPLVGEGRRAILRELLGDDLTLADASQPVGTRTFAGVDVDISECFMCGACSRACPTDAIGYDPSTGVLDFSHLECVNCGLCTTACPADAVTLTSGFGPGPGIFERKVLVEDEVVACTGCGQPFLPKRLAEYSAETVESWDLDLPSATLQIDRCGDCRSIDWERSVRVSQGGVGIPLVDRRQFLKGMGAGTAGAALLALSGTSPASAAEPAVKVAPKRLAMVIDMDRCIGCHACTAACKAENHVPLGVFRDWVEEHVLGTYPHARPVFLPKLCNHCDDPGCMRACPTGAIFRRADGIVDINHDICIGCRACNQACPYACTFMDPVRGTADKCNFCSHRIDQGLNPACVDVCPTGCRIFGDLDDPDSLPSAYLNEREPTVLRQELGLGPNVKYLGLPGVLNR